jgi:hypothetical protein
MSNYKKEWNDIKNIVKIFMTYEKYCETREDKQGDFKYLILNLAASGNVKIIEYLENLGYRGNYLALDAAIRHKNMEAVEYLVQHNYIGKSCVINAIYGKNLECIKYFIEKKYEVPKDAIDMTITSGGNLEIIKYFHDEGYRGSRDVINKVINTTIFCSTQDNNIDIIKYLEEQGYEKPRDAIEQAIMNEKRKTVEYLILNDYLITDKAIELATLNKMRRIKNLMMNKKRKREY